MTGALLQLVAVGSQDLYFIGNPQISFFKSVFKSHTNFSMESINVYFDGIDKLNYNNFTKLYVKYKHTENKTLCNHLCCLNINPGTNNTYKLNAEQGFEKFNLGISYMNGLRNPTLYEMFGTDNYGYSGNRDLKPEKSNTYEIYSNINY